MKRINITKSLEIYRKSVKIIPGGSQTISKRPENFAFGSFPIFLEKGKARASVLCFRNALSLSYCSLGIARSSILRLRTRPTLLSLAFDFKVESIYRFLSSPELIQFLFRGVLARAIAFEALWRGLAEMFSHLLIFGDR